MTISIQYLLFYGMLLTNRRRDIVVRKRAFPKASDNFRLSKSIDDDYNDDGGGDHRHKKK